MQGFSATQRLATCCGPLNQIFHDVLKLTAHVALNLACQACSLLLKYDAAPSSCLQGALHEKSEIRYHRGNSKSLTWLQRAVVLALAVADAEAPRRPARSRRA